MKSRRLMLVAAAAIAITAGCSKKPPKELPPAPSSGSENGAATGTNEGSGAIRSGSRADFLQAVPSDRIFFDTDQYNVDDQDRATLDAQAAWLQRNGNVRVTIEGHADERGTREYNLALGARRAAATKEYLASRGVPANRMKTISYGKERPVAVCDDISCWSQNRRAVTALGGGSNG